MADNTRIYRSPAEFDDYMNRIDDFQFEIITPPSTKTGLLSGRNEQYGYY